ncbi:hypothetical protein DBV15_02861 [Temnothorax longispinosus]|uniref:Uncharacterized protein n=1 Tax=Temnothorax longispinosus TaxID=300112 RepID=A0A4S2L848_9HYME|nr:hypothetical protein DBV15_02861 [Temnothorax longispinosus]
METKNETSFRKIDVEYLFLFSFSLARRKNSRFRASRNRACWEREFRDGRKRWQKKKTGENRPRNCAMDVPTIFNDFRGVWCSNECLGVGPIYAALEKSRGRRVKINICVRLLSRSSPGSFEDLYAKGLRGSACINTIETETGARRAFYFRLRHTLEKTHADDRLADSSGCLGERCKTRKLSKSRENKVLKRSKMNRTVGASWASRKTDTCYHKNDKARLEGVVQTVASNPSFDGARVKGGSHNGKNPRGRLYTGCALRVQPGSYRPPPPSLPSALNDIQNFVKPLEEPLVP